MLPDSIKHSLALILPRFGSGPPIIAAMAPRLAQQLETTRASQFL